MKTRLKRPATWFTILLFVAFFSLFAIIKPVTSAAGSEGQYLDVSAVIDMLLYPKTLEDIALRSQWDGKTLLTSDNNAAIPLPAAPLHCEITGSLEPDDQVFYTVNSALESAFGSVVYESITYPYWESENGIVINVTPEELVEGMPFEIFVTAPDHILELNALTGLWGADSLYTIADTTRIYYSLASAEPVYFTVGVVPGADADGNALPDAIADIIGNNIIWSGADQNRHVVGSDLNFDDNYRSPDQLTGTVRFIQEPGITIDLPTTYSFYDAGLAAVPERVLGIIQNATQLDAVIDAKIGMKAVGLQNFPGTPLLDGRYFAVHYFKTAGTLQPIEDISPLEAIFTMQGFPSLVDINPIYQRLAIWRYPLVLHSATGTYVAPTDGEYTLAKAQGVSCQDGVFTARISQDGLLLPTITEFWLDKPFPYILAAGSEKKQPLVVSGFFPTWMSANPATGVSPSEAALQYSAEIDKANLTLRNPENEIDGFAADYAVSPVLDTQTPNTMYLWAPENLIAGENTPVHFGYHNNNGDLFEGDIPVTIASTSKVTTEVVSTVSVSPAAATVTLSPEQSDVILPAGFYPLEPGRFFNKETVSAALANADGWGVIRWLQDGIEISTSPSCTIASLSGDTTLAAEVASYALDITVVPDSGLGEISLTPAPVSGTPGYAPGTLVTIEITPVSGTVFEGWTGANASDLVVDPDAPNRATLVMNADKSIKAVVTEEIVQQQVLLVVSVQPSGSGNVSYSVDDSPMQPFPETGTLVLDTNVMVTLSAVPASADYRFLNWQVDGSIEETASTFELLMDEDKNVSANFGETVILTIEDSPNGSIEIITPDDAIPCEKSPQKTTAYCLPIGTEVLLRAKPNDPNAFVLNAWWLGNLEINGANDSFGEEYSFTITRDTSIMADFRRKLRVDGVSLSQIPVNRSVPLSLTGVFPTWMGTEKDKAFPYLTAEQAEAVYEISIGGKPASFIAPAESPFLPQGEGVTALDEMDMDATNTAYIWSPGLLELEEEDNVVLVTIRDKINPLNAVEIPLGKEAFVTVVTLTVESLPLNTSGVVLVTPPRGTLPSETDPPLELATGEYILGDSASLSAVPTYALIKYLITTKTGQREITSPTYTIKLNEDTHATGVFDKNAYKLTLVDSDTGTITTIPSSSPGWPVGWYAAGTKVQASATPNTGFRFVSWSHDLAGEIRNPLPITMEQNITLGITCLTPAEKAINILPATGGSVVLQPEGIADEFSPNLFVFAANTPVRIIGNPAPGYRFDKWRVVDAFGESFLDVNPLDLIVSRDYTLQPAFVRTYSLDLSVTPEDGGEIVVAPPVPAGGYDAGTVVTLTAVPAEETGYRFIQWTGTSATNVIPNSTTAAITVIMDSDKQLSARFSKFFVASIEPEQAWVIGGIVAKITGEALNKYTTVNFGGKNMSVFDVAPSGQFAFVRVPELSDPGPADAIKVSLEITTDNVSVTYPPGFTYLQRTNNSNLYTTAFIARQAGAETQVFLGRIGGQDATITLPPLGEAPVYGIVRVASKGLLATARTGIAENLPGTSAAGLYDVGIHLYMPKVGAADVPQFGIMSYQDVTQELLAFNRPFKPENASPTLVSYPALLSMAVQPDAAPTFAAVRNGISLWGVASNYDYLYNSESAASNVSVYQSSLQNSETTPENDPTLALTDVVRAIKNVRLYGGDADTFANCFTWRSNAILPAGDQRAIKITAINNLPVNGTGSGTVEGGTVVTLTSPYGGLAWIQEIEFDGAIDAIGGKVATRDMVSIQGENEFLLEFKTPKSARPGMTSIIIRTKANPSQPIVLQNVFQYTRPPIRWWLILMILIGLMLSVIGMATGF